MQVYSHLNPDETAVFSIRTGKPAMFHALVWSVVFSLLALWSLAAWALHAVAAWSLASAGALTGATVGLEAATLPAWLAPWMPAEAVHAMTWLASGMAPVVQGMLQAMPAAGGLLAVATWTIWGAGAAMLLLAGAGMHLLTTFLRRRSGGYNPLQHLEVTR